MTLSWSVRTCPVDISVQCWANNHHAAWPALITQCYFWSGLNCTPATHNRGMPPACQRLFFGLGPALPAFFCGWCLLYTLCRNPKATVCWRDTAGGQSCTCSWCHLQWSTHTVGHWSIRLVSNQFVCRHPGVEVLHSGPRWCQPGPLLLVCCLSIFRTTLVCMLCSVQIRSPQRTLHAIQPLLRFCRHASVPHALSPAAAGAAGVQSTHVLLHIAPASR